MTPLNAPSYVLPSLSTHPVNNKIDTTNISFRMWTTASKAIETLAASMIGAAAATIAFSGDKFFVCSLLTGATALFTAKFLLDKAKISEIQRKKTQEFIDILIDRVKACIQYNSQYTNKEEITYFLDQLKNQSYYIENGNDDIRVKFVGSQGAIEHVLACSQALQEVHSLVGAIHTPTPPTPLCIRLKDDFAKDLLDSSLVHNLDKLLTVRSRAETIRQYLHSGALLYAIYPKGGLEKRTEDEQTVYKKEVQKHPTRLIDSVLECTEMDPDMVGATYLFKDKNDNQYSFSIKARQINHVQKQAEWGIWLGAISNPIVKKRVDLIFNYLKENKGPNLTV